MRLISWLTQNPATITFVGALIAALGALIVGVGTYLQADLQREKSDRIASLSEQNAALSGKIAESTEITLSTVTGGDSICYLRMVSGGGDPNKPFLTLMHEGRYPLHDVQIRIWDPKVYEGDPHSFQLEEFLAKSTILPVIPTLGPSRVLPIRRWDLPTSDKQDYAVSITGRHQDFTEYIKLRRIKGDWEQGLRLYRGMDVNKPPLKEFYSEGFPKNKDGHVKWD